MFGMSLTKIASALVAVSVIGGGALTLDRMHVAASVFDSYVFQQESADERDYILRLKGDIRDVRAALQNNPDDQYLRDSLADMLDELCEIRPKDRLCLSTPA